MVHRRLKFMGLLTQCPLYLTAVGNSYIERWGRFSIHPADTFLPEGIIRGIGMGTLSQRDEGEKLLATSLTPKKAVGQIILDKLRLFAEEPKWPISLKIPFQASKIQVPDSALGRTLFGRKWKFITGLLYLFLLSRKKIFKKIF